MKQEWRKSEKATYLPKNKPELVDIPGFQYITISGQGNPNTDQFADCIGVLFSLSYAIKMNLKKLTPSPNGYLDYTVYPLEGVWGITEEAKNNFTGKINKDDFVYDLMIRQPDFVNQLFFEAMLEFTKKKKPHPFLDKVQFRKISDGKCIQMLHLGSYDDEPASFKLMEEYASSQNITRQSKEHREIYLTDFRKVPAENLKTVLRFQVQK